VAVVFPPSSAIELEDLCQLIAVRFSLAAGGVAEPLEAAQTGRRVVFFLVVLGAFDHLKVLDFHA
jgi:hypothetical protein